MDSLRELGTDPDRSPSNLIVRVVAIKKNLFCTRRAPDVTDFVYIRSVDEFIQAQSQQKSEMF